MKRIFGLLGRTLFRPYSEPVKRISADAEKIKGHFQEARKVRENNENYEYIDKDKETLERIHSSKDAFEILYEKNGWNEEQLAAQIVGVRRAKWVGWIGLWLSILIPVIVCIYSNSIWTLLFTVFGGLISVINFGSRGLKYSIFEAQLNLHDLLSFKDFWAREDKWKWILR